MHLANIAKEQGAEVGEGSTGKVGVARDRRSWNAHVRSSSLGEGKGKVGGKGGVVWIDRVSIHEDFSNFDRSSFVLETRNFRSGDEKRKEKKKETKYRDIAS